MTTFEQLIALRPTDAGFEVDIPDTWQQGRGAFGGLVIGMLANAIQDSEPDRGRVFRSISADLCGPTQVGRGEIRVSTLRRGNKLSAYDAQLWQDDQVMARASAILAYERGIETPALIRAPQDVKDWRELDPVELPAQIAPIFTQHLDFWVTGNYPFCGGEPTTEGWVRFKNPGECVSAATILALLDAYWPTSFVASDRPRPTATVAYSAQILSDVSELKASEPLYYRARAVAGYGGYYVENRELWLGETLIALNQQTFAIIA